MPFASGQQTVLARLVLSTPVTLGTQGLRAQPAGFIRRAMLPPPGPPGE